MKKFSSKIVKDYSKYNSDSYEYYGLLIKDGRTRIDTKRYKKFFVLPDNKIEHRKTVYYVPTKIDRKEYATNQFRDTLSILKDLWINEFSRAIKAIKTPKQVEEDVRINSLQNGILEHDESSIAGTYYGIKRDNKYRYVIKSIYAQFFHQMMSQIDALSLRVCVSQGYQEKDFTREKFDVFIQGKQKENPISFYDYKYYSVYDKAYRTCNFLKHNSTKSYWQLKNKYPNMIYDCNNGYQNGDPAITVLKIDERFIIDCLDTLHLFFDEVCTRGFDEKTDDTQWDYDGYFIDIIRKHIRLITTPLDLPDSL